MGGDVMTVMVEGAPAITVSTETDTSHEGRWLTIKDAAAALSISERSVRRHAQRGRLRSRFRERLTEVWVGTDTELAEEDGDVLPPATDTPMTATVKTAPATDATAPGVAKIAPATDSAATQALAALDGAVSELATLLREERESRSRAEQAAAMYQERARNLEAENAKLQELLALPAYEEPEPPRRWWQFLRKRG